MNDSRETKESTVGSFVQNLEFSEKEKDRIAAQLKEKSKIQEIFLANAQLTHSFQRIVKEIKVPGQSAGRKGHTKGALKIVIKNLTKGTTDQKRIGWEIYKNSIVEHTHAKQENLNKLLSQVPVDDENPSSGDLLEIICKNAKQYEVASESVEELYEIWGFDRIKNFKALLPLCIKDHPAERRLKELNELKNTVVAVSQQLTTRDEKLDTDATNIGALQNDVDSLKKSLKNLQENVADISSNIKLLPFSSEKKQQQTNEQTKKHLKELDSNLSKHTSSAEKLFKNFSIQIERINKSVNTKIEKELQPWIRTINETDKKHLDHIDSKIERKFEHLKESLSFSAKPSQIGSECKSLLTGGVAQKQILKGKINDEWRFVCIWQKHLQAELDIILPVEIVAIIHVIFKSSYSLILDNDEVFYSWLQTLGWAPYNFEVVASPNWTSESDWRDGTQYLFGEENTSIPKIVTIHHYNVALASCYLVPTLKMWSLQPSFHQLSKLILIESGSENRKPTSDLLEFSTYFTQHEFSHESYPILKDRQREAPSGKELSHTGVSPDTFKSWTLGPGKEDLPKSEIEAIAEIANIKLPGALKFHCSKIYSELWKLFSEDDSRIVSAWHVIIPWIKASNNDDKVKKFLKTFESMFSKKILYFNFPKKMEND